MQLTQFSDYALRLMMVVASKKGELITIEEAAVTYGISRAHLMKVAQLLVRQGFLISVRGRSGGLTLSRPPASILIGDIVRATETDFAMVECMQRGNRCKITPACRLRGILGDAVAAFLTVLDRFSLEDLLLSPEDFGFPAAA